MLQLAIVLVCGSPWVVDFNSLLALFHTSGQNHVGVAGCGAEIVFLGSARHWPAVAMCFLDKLPHHVHRLPEVNVDRGLDHSFESLESPATPNGKVRSEKLGKAFFQQSGPGFLVLSEPCEVELRIVSLPVHHGNRVVDGNDLLLTIDHKAKLVDGAALWVHLAFGHEGLSDDLRMVFGKSCKASKVVAVSQLALSDILEVRTMSLVIECPYTLLHSCTSSSVCRSESGNLAGKGGCRRCEGGKSSQARHDYGGLYEELN
mmetsp:Transcript_2305/g.5469  ORF Transcript_2305/g.5469 Transcript_2305/m.5469 type:complete len:260 (+) Transcript_2305:1814-2593(+)